MTQGQIRQALRNHGNLRARARVEAVERTAKIAALVPEALAAGMTKREVCALAQISRPALDAMLKEE